MIHLKDMLLLGFVVFSLILLADDGGEIRSKISNFAESVENPEPEISAASVALPKDSTPETDTADEYRKEADSLRKKGDSQYGLALAALEREDWSECLNRCISSRNYYARSIDQYELAIEDWEDVDTESNPVLRAFIGTSIEYYSCIQEVSTKGMELCIVTEEFCLEESQDESGNIVMVEETRTSFDETEESCGAILEGISGSE